MVSLKYAAPQYGRVLCTNRTTDQACVQNGAHMFNLWAMACPKGTGALPALQGPFHKTYNA